MGQLSLRQFRLKRLTSNELNAEHSQPTSVSYNEKLVRYLSFVSKLGYGARGIGFRDSSQDTLGVITHMPEEAREFIEASAFRYKTLMVQRCTSSSHLRWKRTQVTREEEDRPDYYGDDHLWIVYAVTQYVKETGNAAFLDKLIPFYQKISKANRLNRRACVGTLGAARLNSLAVILVNMACHCFGFADWNDTVNLPTGAESLMVASMYGKSATRYARSLSLAW